MTLEKAIEWCFGISVEPACEDRPTRLMRSEGPHIQHRTWFDSPRRVIQSILGASKKRGR